MSQKTNFLHFRDKKVFTTSLKAWSSYQAFFGHLVISQTTIQLKFFQISVCTTNNCCKE